MADLRTIQPLQGPYASNADEKLRQKINEVAERVNTLLKIEIDKLNKNYESQS